MAGKKSEQVKVEPHVGRHQAAKRLAAQKQEQAKDAGRAAVEWVRTTADYRDLVRLRRAVQNSDRNGSGEVWDLIIGASDRAGGTRDVLADAILGPKSGGGTNEFWTEMLGTDYEELIEDGDYIASFLDAALAELAEIEKTKEFTAA